MTHSSFFWCSSSSNETNNRLSLWIIFSKPITSLFFIFSSNFSNHNNAFSFRIFHESAEDINKVSSIEWISTNSNNSWLAQALFSWLVHCFISKCAWSRNNTNFSWLMNMSWHYANFTFIWLYYSGTVRPN